MQQAQRAGAERDLGARARRTCRSRRPQELVILASIVEKETGTADERTRVAGVFINRLSRSMKLQSDPTIVYGLVGGKGTLGRGILRSRDRPGDALQHLRDRGPAAGADRQSRPGRARGGRQSVAHARTSISSPTARAATSSPRRSTSTEERRALAPDREGPRRRRAGRRPRRAAAGGGRDEHAADARRRPGHPARRAGAGGGELTSGGNRPNASGSARGRAFDASEGTAARSAPQPGLRPQLAEDRAGAEDAVKHDPEVAAGLRRSCSNRARAGCDSTSVIAR